MDGENGTETPQQKPGLRERIGRRAWVRSAALVGSGVIVGGIVAGTVAANAADDGAPGPSTSQEDARPGPGHRGPHGDRGPSQAHHPDEELLTGETATQVTEAVLAEYPDATIHRVETDSDGVYEAHIRTADGERLTVELGEDFEITGTESRD